MARLIPNPYLAGLELGASTGKMTAALNSIELLFLHARLAFSTRRPGEKLGRGLLVRKPEIFDALQVRNDYAV